jgi:hypothetical protein
MMVRTLLAALVLVGCAGFEPSAIGVDCRWVDSGTEPRQFDGRCYKLESFNGGRVYDTAGSTCENATCLVVSEALPEVGFVVDSWNPPATAEAYTVRTEIPCSRAATACAE